MNIYTLFILWTLGLFTPKQPSSIEVIQVNNMVLLDHKTDALILEACSSWHLSKDEVELFFILSTKITPYKVNDFSYFPCEIDGKLIINDTIFNFKVNGAGWAKLEFKGREQFFHCNREICEYIGI